VSAVSAAFSLSVGMVAISLLLIQFSQEAFAEERRGKEVDRMDIRVVKRV
jgi:hypothetical protein